MEHHVSPRTDHHQDGIPINNTPKSQNYAKPTFTLGPEMSFENGDEEELRFSPTELDALQIASISPQDSCRGSLVTVQSEDSSVRKRNHPLSAERSLKGRRTRSLYGASPNCNFGPKGCILETAEELLTIQDPANQKLKWHKPPHTVLIVQKICDISVIIPFKELIYWLIQEKQMTVYVESKSLEGQSFNEDEPAGFKQIRHKLKTVTQGEDDLTDRIDFIICLGGDGTLLHASTLFQRSVPPVMAFHMGSLGFLSPFDFVNYQDQVNQVLQGNAALILRSRLKCAIFRKDTRTPHSKHTEKHSGTVVKLLVLNEVVIDRGPAPYLCHLDLYIEGRLVTSVQGDGLIIATPTGSTAYSVSAGASMMHPNVPAIMITPICPHSLSFRPIVVPAGVDIKVMLSPDARQNAWVSFDGRNRQEILQGDSLRLTTAVYPLPSVCKSDQIDDWFNSLAECLHWNVRRPQKSLSTNFSILSLDSSDSENTSPPREIT